MPISNVLRSCILAFKGLFSSASLARDFRATSLADINLPKPTLQQRIFQVQVTQAVVRTITLEIPAASDAEAVERALAEAERIQDADFDLNPSPLKAEGVVLI